MTVIEIEKDREMSCVSCGFKIYWGKIPFYSLPYQSQALRERNGRLTEWEDAIDHSVQSTCLDLRRTRL